MKAYKIFTGLLLISISFTQVQGQVASVDSAELETKATINNSDKKAIEIQYDGINYYVIDGLWHTKFKNRLILRQPPKGLRIKFLPKNGKNVVMGGKKYYKCKGIFYKKIKKGLYEIAKP